MNTSDDMRGGAGDGDAAIRATVSEWLVSIVIGLGLCPFASREVESGRVRIAVCHATREDELLLALKTELECLLGDADIATSLLVHPWVLRDFADYNQFLDQADALIAGMGLEGVFQIASFHPVYQYAGTEVGDAENCINRSPFPLLHLLREAGVSAAVSSAVDVDQIPERNIKRMQELGRAGYEARLRRCFERGGAALPESR